MSMGIGRRDLPPQTGVGPGGPAYRGETPEQRAYRLYSEQRQAEQQAEQRAYNDWQQAEAIRRGEWQSADARAYGEYLNADARAYGNYQTADARAYNEARQAQADAERRAAQAADNAVRIAQGQTDLVANERRNVTGLAGSYAQQAQRGRQSLGGITQLYQRVLGGY